MKLNKKIILICAVIQFIFVIGIYIFGSMEGSKSLGIMELVFLVFLSLIFGLFVNIFFILIEKIVKSITNK